MKSIEYLDLIRKIHGVSDYAAAPLLGVTKSQISSVRRGKSGFGDKPALRIAQLLNLSPHEVLANLMAERCSNDEVRAVWKEIAPRFAACLVLALSIGQGTLPDPPDFRIIQSTLYYVKSQVSDFIRSTLRHLSDPTVSALNPIAYAYALHTTNNRRRFT